MSFVAIFLLFTGSYFSFLLLHTVMTISMHQWCTFLSHSDFCFDSVFDSGILNFCKCVFASGRVSPPFVPSRNLKESRLSFCKVLPPQNHNGDDVFASCCLRQGAFGPHLYRLEISKFRNGLLRHSKLLQLTLARVTVRFRGHFYRLEISRFLFFLTILQIVATGAVVLSHCFCSKPSPPAAAFRPLVKKYDHDNQNMIFPPADKGASRRRRW
mgnify:CR=1 FL=1